MASTITTICAACEKLTSSSYHPRAGDALAPRGLASPDFSLLEAGDRVLVAVSGGKDSHALLYLLREIARRAPFKFSIIAVNVDQGHPGFPKTLLPDYFRREGYDFEL